MERLPKPNRPLEGTALAVYDSINELIDDYNDRVPFDPLGTRDQRCEDLEARIAELTRWKGEAMVAIDSASSHNSFLNAIISRLSQKVEALEKKFETRYQTYGPGGSLQGVPVLSTSSASNKA